MIVNVAHSLPQLDDSAIKNKAARCWKHRRSPNQNGSLGDRVMAKSQLPSPEAIRQLLRYEPETGKLFWKERGPEWFADKGCGGAVGEAARWNGQYAQKVAFTAVKDGYHTSSLLGRPFRAHRVIWAMVYGEWPKLDIDHINGDRRDNRILNLRQVTRADNLRNVRRRSDNTSGVVGVTWDAAHSAWRAQISVRSKKLYLGIFPKLEDAAAARKAAEAAHNFHPNHGRD